MKRRDCSVSGVLRQAQAAGVDRLDAQLILAQLLQRSRTWLLAHPEAPLPDAGAAAWPALLARRAAGEPLAYVLGQTEFCGLTLKVTPAVLIPRPETEGLVRWALEHPAGRIADLGTGSGAIALALKHALPGADVLATDLSAAALAVAADNAARLGLPLRLRAGAWWAAASGEPLFGLVVSNPPYIAPGDPHLAALGHEPELALTSGDDGLAALSSIVSGAGPRLLPGAWLLLEHGHDQAEAVQLLLSRHGFTDVQTRADLAGLPRCTGARWPGAK
jgi:release factor glutamine methyltransferase